MTLTQRLVILHVLNMFANIPPWFVVMLPVKELQTLKESYELALFMLPKPRWQQFVLRYICHKLSKEIAGIEKIIDTAAGLADKFSNFNFKDLHIISGELPK